MIETDIRRIDVSLLLILRELARERRTTVVANRLGLSQSAVSHALARLRDVLKDPLFVRRSNGLEPTARCLEYLPKVESLLGLARELVDGNAAFDPATTTRTFTLAGHDVVLARIMTPLIARVRREAPRARIGFRSAAGAKALEHLERREADIAFGTFGKLPNAFIAERVPLFLAAFARLRQPYVTIPAAVTRGRCGQRILLQRTQEDDRAQGIASDRVLAATRGAFYEQ
jgi:DNA-binding transcriptional LysR family regulator